MKRDKNSAGSTNPSQASTKVGGREERQSPLSLLSPHSHYTKPSVTVNWQTGGGINPDWHRLWAILLGRERGEI